MATSARLTSEKVAAQPKVFSGFKSNASASPYVPLRDCANEGATALPAVFTYEILDCTELAERLKLPVSWVRDNVRPRTFDPIPHSKFGKYVRFAWGSPDLEGWLKRRMIGAPNNRCTLVQ